MKKLLASLLLVFGLAPTISYQLGRAGQVALTIHDVAGKAVQRLA